MLKLVYVFNSVECTRFQVRKLQPNVLTNTHPGKHFFMCIVDRNHVLRTVALSQSICRGYSARSVRELANMDGRCPYPTATSHPPPRPRLRAFPLSVVCCAKQLQFVRPGQERTPTHFYGWRAGAISLDAHGFPPTVCQGPYQR